MVKNYYSMSFDVNMSRAYFQVCDAIRTYKRSTTVYTRFNENEVKQIGLAVLCENPEFVHCYVQSISVSTNSLSTTFNFSYDENIDVGLFDNTISRVMDELGSQISDTTSDWEKAKIIFDYIVHNVQYDRETQFDYMNGIGSNNSQIKAHHKSYTAYGAIVDKNAVCLGISLLYVLLLDKYYIESCVVPVKDLAGNPHSINVVEIDGIRAYVDVTYGMSLRDSSDKILMVNYDVFMLDDEDIKKYFNLDATYGCDTKSQGYYYKNNLVFSSTQRLRQYLYSYTYHKSDGEIRCMYTGSLNDRYLEQILRSAMKTVCGNMYDVADGYINYGKINCKINIRKG